MTCPSHFFLLALPLFFIRCQAPYARCSPIKINYEESKYIRDAFKELDKIYNSGGEVSVIKGTRENAFRALFNSPRNGDSNKRRNCYKIARGYIDRCIVLQSFSGAAYINENTTEDGICALLFHQYLYGVSTPRWDTEGCGPTDATDAEKELAYNAFEKLDYKVYDPNTMGQHILETEDGNGIEVLHFAFKTGQGWPMDQRVACYIPTRNRISFCLNVQNKSSGYVVDDKGCKLAFGKNAIRWDTIEI